MWLIAALVISTAAFAQHEEPVTAIVGTVQSVSGNQIHVLSGANLLTLHVDDHTEIWKGKALRDLPPLEMGDDISARCRKVSGELLAEAIWINIVNFSGVITKVKGSTFEVSRIRTPIRSQHTKRKASWFDSMPTRSFSRVKRVI